MSLLMDYIQLSAKAKNKSATNWLTEMAKDAKQKCVFATHISRFTHPGADVPLYTESNCIKKNGYVYTTNTVCQSDIAVSAAFVSAAKLMMFVMEDGRPFIDHLQENDLNIQKDIESLQLDYNEIREKFLQVKKATPDGKTDERIKQVYFPVAAGEYHLLSVLPSASLLMESKQRIRRIDNQRRNSRDSKSDEYGKAYRQIYNITEIGYGGTKSQNISWGNMKQGGKAFLLPSVPPKIKQQKLVVPKKDFFVNSLRIKAFRNLFQSLQGIFVFDKHNMPTRQKRDEIIDAILDRVLEKVYVLQSLEEKWSDKEDCKLPEEQKIWLDEQYYKQREETAEWIDPVAARFARWMFLMYDKIVEKGKFNFGDAEFITLREHIKKVLWKDRDC